jgi:hypothetical protein
VDCNADYVYSAGIHLSLHEIFTFPCYITISINRLGHRDDRVYNVSVGKKINCGFKELNYFNDRLIKKLSAL